MYRTVLVRAASFTLFSVCVYMYIHTGVNKNMLLHDCLYVVWPLQLLKLISLISIETLLIISVASVDLLTLRDWYCLFPSLYLITCSLTQPDTNCIMTRHITLDNLTLTLYCDTPRHLRVPDTNTSRHSIWHWCQLLRHVTCDNPTLIPSSNLWHCLRQAGIHVIWHQQRVASDKRH